MQGLRISDIQAGRERENKRLRPSIVKWREQCECSGPITGRLDPNNGEPQPIGARLLEQWQSAQPITTQLPQVLANQESDLKRLLLKSLKIISFGRQTYMFPSPLIWKLSEIGFFPSKEIKRFSRNLDTKEDQFKRSFCDLIFDIGVKIHNSLSKSI